MTTGSMRIAIETGQFAPNFEDFTPDIAAVMAAKGVDGIICQFGVAEGQPPRDPRTVTVSECERIRELLRENDLGIAYSWGFWSSLIHKDPAVRRDAVERSEAALRIASWLGAPAVVSGPGSHHPAHGWYPHPDNITPESLGRLTESVRALAPTAEDLGVAFVLKGHTLSTLDTPEDVLTVIRAVGSPAIRGGLDPVNWMKLEYVWDPTELVDHICQVLGQTLAIAHAKDFVLDPQLILHLTEVPVSEGWMDYPAFVRRYFEALPTGWIALEHLPLDKIDSAVAHMRSSCELLSEPVS